MKVLWFSNTPASGAEFLNMKTFGGGWLKSLDKLLKDKAELSVAFYYPKKVENFRYSNINYYPIVNKYWQLNLIRNLINPKFINREDLKRYLDIIEKVNPDIIHIWGTENPFGSIISEVRIPVIISIQGIISVIISKFFSGIPKKEIFKIKVDLNGYKSFPFIKSFKSNFNYLKKASKREIENIKNCRFVIGRTDWDRIVTRVLAPNSIYFHNDEVLRNIFYEEEWSQPKNNKLIIHTTTSNSPYKGFETLCYSLSLLNKSKKEIEWRVAGIDEDSLIVKVTRKFLGNNYPTKGLKLLGSLDENELVKKMKEADLYVLPSHIENSPNSLCEAMILGMPCIATYAGGTPSLLENGKEGILVPDGDPWALAGAIIELSENKEKSLALGKAARIRALKRHDKVKIVEELLEIYRTVIDYNKNKL